jgi:hypothetical protein
MLPSQPRLFSAISKHLLGSCLLDGMEHRHTLQLLEACVATGYSSDADLTRAITRRAAQLQDRCGLSSPLPASPRLTHTSSTTSPTHLPHTSHTPPRYSASGLCNLLAGLAALGSPPQELSLSLSARIQGAFKKGPSCFIGEGGRQEGHCHAS